MTFTLRQLSILLLLFSFTWSGCFIFRPKKTCPAYMNGSSTGMSGGGKKGKKNKSQELFPKKMRRR